jgi:predicted nucleic acid-binding protein
VIVVDTTVWVDFLGAKGTSFDLHLAELIERGDAIALTDLIYCEILQGIRDQTKFAEVRDILRSYPILRLKELDTFEQAAGIYRDCRRRGFTIRKTIDCLIASTCLNAGAELYHNDRDYEFIARVRNLKIYCPTDS